MILLGNPCNKDVTRVTQQNHIDSVLTTCNPLLGSQYQNLGQEQEGGGLFALQHWSHETENPAVASSFEGCNRMEEGNGLNTYMAVHKTVPVISGQFQEFGNCNINNNNNNHNNHNINETLRYGMNSDTASSDMSVYTDTNSSMHIETPSDMGTNVGYFNQSNLVYGTDGQGDPYGHNFVYSDMTKNMMSCRVPISLHNIPLRTAVA